MNFASLFSGCGGFDVGYESKGFQSRGAYDLDPDACDNFRANVGANIFNVDLSEGVPREHEIYGVDALIAGPPCQGFSTAGKRRVDDERNHLVTLLSG
ncbi:MAG: hypothetical protein COZ50_02860 [Zetaproteobacteria bacterium CG_4_10_14_3_um_filter_54_28]|nr:MAG: hypothetical protein COZ50_02860 [Zetaproteobacteria bacterium CG_4_10_14_3_um_filter_54_28]